MIIENLDFNGSSDILQYIPQVDTAPQQQPSQDQGQQVQQQSSFGLPDELQPKYQTRAIEQPELFKAEIKPPQIQMDFSTPISDVVPSADFDMGPSMGGGPYKNPQNNRVVALSLDNASAGPASPSSKNQFGLTAAQLNAALAGIAAVAAFSKPVQNKLADLIPKFMSDAGDLSATGMLATAFFAAVVFFIIHKFVKPPQKK